MRNLIIGLSLVLGFSSCDKVDELTQFEMAYTQSFTIEAGTPLDVPFQLITPSIETDYQEIYSQYDTRPDKIEEIKLRKVDFTITSPSEGSFNFLESIALSISTSDLEKTDIASKSAIGDMNENSISLETADVNLKDYLSVNEFNLNLDVVTDEVLSEDYVIDIHTVFFVDARVLGQ